ncbi:RNA-directed DNA polymerase, eukaryota, reverse transcriptase zinc-binding domain protein [Tanacetum coccineum]
MNIKDGIFKESIWVYEKGQGSATDMVKRNKVSQISESEIVLIGVVLLRSFDHAFDLRKKSSSSVEVVDAYIPNRRSKAGKRFGFVRFIKVFDVERLVNNICTVWVGSHKLHANLSRFQRVPLNKHSNSHNDNGVKRGNSRDAHYGGKQPVHKVVNKDSKLLGYVNSYMHAVKRGIQPQYVMEENKPTIVLDETCLNHEDFSNSLMGKVKEFSSLATLKMQTSTTFHIDERVTWVDIEGIPLKAWTRNTFNRIASKWGDIVHVDDQDEHCFHNKRICIKTKLVENIFESFKIIANGKVFWVRAKEVSGWIPDFVDEEEDENDSDGEFKEDVLYNENVEKQEYTNIGGESDVEEKKQGNINEDTNSNDTMKYPPGFTPKVTDEVHSNDFKDVETEADECLQNIQDDITNSEVGKTCHKSNSKEDKEESICSGHFKKFELPHTGGSMLQLMEDLVKVGQTIGYNMEGCSKNIKEIIGSHGAHENHMNFMSLNIQGLAQKAKKDWVKELCVNNKVNFLYLQETKIEDIELGKWIPNSKKLLVISIYAPQELSEKKMLWDYLIVVINNWNGDEIIMGDFNEVRTQPKRYGSIFNAQGAATFNSFILAASLEEVPLGGCSFTWCHKSANKMSKLDRFLIFEGLLGSCPNISAYTLDRYLSDHRPILLREAHFDYGPISFRFFITGLKWKDKKEYAYKQKKTLKEKLVDTDLLLDKGTGDSDVINQRDAIFKSLQDIEKHIRRRWPKRLKSSGQLKAMRILNSPSLVKSEFLSHFTNRFNQPGTSRILLNMDFPNKLNIDKQIDLESDVTHYEIKREVWDCVIDKSPGPDGFTFGFYRRYWSFLEKDVVQAVNYFFQHGMFPKGGNSSFIALIPKTQNANMVKDFRPITLIGSLYKIIAKILSYHLVVVLGDIVNEVQSAFVANRQTLDGPLILNELLHWCKKKKKQTMFLRWRGWIQGCLRSSRGSIIVNGSQTNEFQFHRGLKQGDPLSPFLFILVMESLHISVQIVVDAGMFKDISLGSFLHLSHLFYADDVVFMGQWSSSNIDIIIQVLECFYRASGLRINMTKSKLMGIFVPDSIVDKEANKIGCSMLKALFSYLGSKVGDLMSRTQSWNDIINNLSAHLSKWKINTLSIEGRLTLLKSVLGSIPIYHLSLFKAPMNVLQKIESIRCHFFNGVDHNGKKPIWIKWSKVLASKEKGGLGVSSLYALNRALLFKWVWRFYTQRFSLWAKVIRGIHGEDGKLCKNIKQSHPSIWLDIVRETALLKNKGTDLCGFIHKKMGNGIDTSFWNDVWKGDTDFKSLYPRIYALESCKSINVAEKMSHENLGFSLRRDPRGGIEQEQFAKTRWTSVVPIKINVHAWKVRLNCLPTRLNISRRDIEVMLLLVG